MCCWILAWRILSIILLVWLVNFHIQSLQNHKDKNGVTTGLPIKSYNSINTIGWTDAEPETPILWPPDVMSDSSKPMDCSMPGSSDFHSLPEYAQVHAH